MSERSKRVAVVLPPMCQLNTPYPALPYLAGVLRAEGHRVVSLDLSLELLLALLAPDRVSALLALAEANDEPGRWAALTADPQRWAQLAPPLVAFLQGRDLAPTASWAAGRDLPRGPRLRATLEDPAALPPAAQNDRARLHASLVLEDLIDCLRDTISPWFALTNYGAAIAESAGDWALVAAALAIDDPIADLIDDCCQRLIPESVEAVVLSCPFPGNLLAALRIGTWCGRHRPGCRRILGGGYPSTELRELRDPGLFAHLDAVVLDAGEEPLRRLLDDHPPIRTFTLEAGSVRYHPGAGPAAMELRHAPDFTGLDLDRYLDLVDRPNPMHRLWNEGRWQGLTAAAGCYWKRCTFCDITLPYIEAYAPQRARALADQFDAIYSQTGRSGFHLTDEAAPPPLLLGLALELLRRGRRYSWWGNIRFDDGFTADRCRVLAAAGCIAVTGGLELAEDATLARIAKGVDLAQAARVTGNFAAAGILVHAYCMYGFPGADLAAHGDALEALRQLFAAGCLHSAFWHRFTVTAHSPVGRDPAAFGIQLLDDGFAGFARNNLPHRDPTGPDLDRIADAVTAATAAWMRGQDLERPIATWLAHCTSRIAPDAVARARNVAPEAARENHRALYLAAPPLLDHDTIVLTDRDGERYALDLPASERAAAIDLLAAAQIDGWDESGPPRLGVLADRGWIADLRDIGLVLV